MNNGSQGPATKETPLDFPCKCVCHKVGLEGFQCCPCTIKLQAGLPCAKCGRSLQGHYCYFNSPENSTFSFKTAEPQTCQAPARPASSQGPAREETLKALQHDYEQGAFWPFTSWNATCKALSKAFDAGAKSVVAAPQLTREAFEAAAGRLERFSYDFRRSMVRGEPTGEYLEPSTYNAWTGWKLARTADDVKNE